MFHWLGHICPKDCNSSWDSDSWLFQISHKDIIHSFHGHLGLQVNLLLCFVVRSTHCLRLLDQTSATLTGLSALGLGQNFHTRADSMSRAFVPIINRTYSIVIKFLPTKSNRPISIYILLVSCCELLSLRLVGFQ